MEVLIGNVWEARNYAMFEGENERQNIQKKLGQVGKKRVASIWKQIKSLNKSTSIFKLVKANLVSP